MADVYRSPLARFKDLRGRGLSIESWNELLDALVLLTETLDRSPPAPAPEPGGGSLVEVPGGSALLRQAIAERDAAIVDAAAERRQANEWLTQLHDAEKERDAAVLRATAAEAKLAEVTRERDEAKTVANDHLRSWGDAKEQIARREERIAADGLKLTRLESALTEARRKLAEVEKDAQDARDAHARCQDDTTDQFRRGFKAGQDAAALAVFSTFVEGRLPTMAAIHALTPPTPAGEP